MADREAEGLEEKPLYPVASLPALRDSLVTRSIRALSQEEIEKDLVRMRRLAVELEELPGDLVTRRQEYLNANEPGVIEQVSRELPGLQRIVEKKIGSLTLHNKR